MPYKDKQKQKEYQAKWFQENKEKQYARNRLSERNLTLIVREAKAKPCADCNVQYPYYVMHFDHLEDKIDGVSKLMRTSSTQTVLDEIAKCEVVCANCHAERSQQRLSPK